MFKCVECGNLFEDGEVKKHYPGTGEEINACPICKGAYIEVTPCKICGSYEHEQDEQYCDDCKEKVKNKFDNIIKKEFTFEERKLINELYDGESI